MNVLLVDGFCASNRGEAATLAAVRDGLRARLSTVEVRAVSRFPEVSRALVELDTLADTDPVAVAAAVTWADLVVSCGVPLLTDGYPLGLHPRLATLALARRLGRPYVLFAQSLGPFDSPLARTAVRRLCDDAAWVLARDPVSAATVSGLGGRGAVDVGVDVSVLSRVDPEPRAARRATDPPLLGVSVRSWAFPGAPDPALATVRYERAVAAACDAWVARTGGRVRFLSTCTGFGGYTQDDRVAARRVAARMRAPADIRVEEADGHERVRGELAACDLVIGTRLHALLFATDSGVPTVGVAYERRATAHLDAIGLGDYVVPIYAPEGLVPRVLAAEASRSALASRVARHAPEARARAEAQLDRLAELVERAGRGARGRARGPAAATDGATCARQLPVSLAVRTLDAVADIVLAEGGTRVLSIVPSVADGTALADRLGVSYLRTTVVADDAALLHGVVGSAGPYDTVCAAGVLEGCEDPAPLLGALRARLVDGGLAVVTLYNLSHFARRVAPAPPPPTARFAYTPDELALVLASVGLTPERVAVVGAGYGPPDDAAAADLARDGDCALPPARALRLGHVLVFVCRAGSTCVGPRDLPALLQGGRVADAVRAAIELARRVPWAPRAWSDAGACYCAAGLTDDAREAFARAWGLDPGRAEVRENAAFAGVRSADLPAAPPLEEAERALLTEPGDDDAWDRLAAALVGAGRLHAAASVVTLRRRNSAG